MEIGISIVVIIIIWLVASRYKTNKDIKKAFESVEKDKSVTLYAALREVIGYCERNSIEYTLLRQEYLVIEYAQKVITAQSHGGFRTGKCSCFIQ